MKIPGTVAVVTGAASGMGRELAVGMAKRGSAAVAVCDVAMKDLEETVALVRKANANVKVLSMRVDVTDRAQVEQFLARILAELPPKAPMVLFNNAGINAIGKMVYNANEDPKEFERVWDRCFAVDYFGVLNFCRVFMPTLIARPEAYLVNTASVNGFFTWLDHGSYTAAKHAVKGLTDSLRIELAVKAPHVHVSCVMPGGVKTNVAKGTLHPNKEQHAAEFEKMTDFVHNFLFDLTSEEAADWIIGAVEKNQYRVLVGYDAWMLDKMARVFPSYMYNFYSVFPQYGLGKDPFTQMEEAKTSVGPVAAGHMLVSGLWVYAAFMSPMVLVKLRHLDPKLLVAGSVAVAAAASMRGKL